MEQEAVLEPDIVRRALSWSDGFPVVVRAASESDEVHEASDADADVIELRGAMVLQLDVFGATPETTEVVVGRRCLIVERKASGHVERLRLRLRSQPEPDLVTAKLRFGVLSIHVPTGVALAS